MKCVKSKKTGVIERVTDVDAYNLTLTGEWKYISKTEWKLQIRDINTRNKYPANIESSTEFNEVQSEVTTKGNTGRKKGKKSIAIEG
jgi:hypothetical protein